MYTYTDSMFSVEREVQAMEGLDKLYSRLESVIQGNGQVSNIDYSLVKCAIESHSNAAEVTFKEYLYPSNEAFEEDNEYMLGIAMEGILETAKNIGKKIWEKIQAAIAWIKEKWRSLFSSKRNYEEEINKLIEIVQGLEKDNTSLKLHEKYNQEEITNLEETISNLEKELNQSSKEVRELSDKVYKAESKLKQINAETERMFSDSAKIIASIPNDVPDSKIERAAEHELNKDKLLELKQKLTKIAGPILENIATLEERQETLLSLLKKDFPAGSLMGYHSTPSTKEVALSKLRDNKPTGQIRNYIRESYPVTVADREPNMFNINWGIIKHDLIIYRDCFKVIPTMDRLVGDINTLLNNGQNSSFRDKLKANPIFTVLGKILSIPLAVLNLIRKSIGQFFIMTGTVIRIIGKLISLTK